MATRKAGAGTGKTEGASSPRSIVLADDDPSVLEALGELLRHKGHDVHGARDSLDALRTIRTLKPDYVILDVLMPKLDGSRVCAMIRHDPLLRHTPVIVLSGLSPEQLRRFPALSADAYVAKGPLAVMATNVLQAIKNLEERGRGDLSGGIFGYEGFRARSLVGEMLAARQHWEALVRIFPYAVLELDAEGVILMANAEASRLLGRQESRLIGEPLAMLFPSPKRRAVEEALADLTKNRVGDQIRMVAVLGDREVSVRLASVAEAGECSGVLVTLEPVPPQGAGARPPAGGGTRP